MFLAVLLAVSVTAEAQQPKKLPRIGLLSPTFDDFRVEAFRQGLRELGYVDGQNITIEYRWAAGKFNQLPDMALELVRLKVDVIVAVVTQASLAAKKATATIPIVMIGVSDPVASGLVFSLARPGANITGNSSMTAEVVGKQLELLKETLHKISRVAALWNPANPVFQGIQRKEAEEAARVVGCAPSHRGGATRRGNRPRLLSDGERAHKGTHRPKRPGIHRSSKTNCRSFSEAPHPGRERDIRVHRGWRSHGLWAELSRHIQARRYVCG
jgi:ABC transporter substrate binding protein